MKAPEKIYVQLPSRKWIGRQWGETPIKEGDNPNWKNATNIEYIRKDAFIEKACEWLKKNATYTHPRKGTTECIVNLNAFKEAMSNNTMSYKCKLDKIIDTVVWYIHLRNEGMISGTCGDFESLLKEIDSVINSK